ncbi:hypothetical protein [Kitasatospora sp. NPDC050543]
MAVHEFRILPDGQAEEVHVWTADDLAFAREALSRWDGSRKDDD